MPSFPRRRESRPWDNGNIQRLSESPRFWIPTFVGMTGCRFVGMTWCRFPYGWIRHSRAGGNLDLRTTAIFKDYKRPVIPAQAGI
ncbi:hypothetical protein COH31_09580 [Neisseria meningitidis]|nr:hypothetical protein COH31_09580 [Neisseria meningitidis]